MIKKMFAIFIAVFLMPVAFSQSNTTTLVISDFRDDFQTVTPRAGWQYLWNSGGVVGNPTNYSSLIFCGFCARQFYTTDGGPIPNPSPGSFTFIERGAAHPGPGASQAGFPRYAIAAYTVSLDGVYSLTNAAVQRQDLRGPSDGLRIIVHVNNDAARFEAVVSDNGDFDADVYDFDMPLGELSAGDTIYVAVGPNGIDSFDGIFMDFSISRDVRGEAQGQSPFVRVITLFPTAGAPFDKARGTFKIFQTEAAFGDFTEFAVQGLPVQVRRLVYAVYATTPAIESGRRLRVKMFNTTPSGSSASSFAGMPDEDNPAWLEEDVTIEVYIEEDDGFDAPDIGGLLVLKGFSAGVP